MTNKRSAILTLAASLFCGSVAAADGIGGFGGGCGVVTICSGGHRVPGPGPAGVQNPHSDCSVCVEANCHPACGLTLAPSIRGLYADVVKAANAADVRALLSLGKGLHGFVTYNESRQATQVTSCDRITVIANIPLKRAFEVAIARRVLSGEATQVVASTYGFAAHVAWKATSIDH